MQPHVLLDAVRRDRNAWLPFVGAGLAIPAGAPSSERLAEELAATAGVSSAGLTAVVRAAEQLVGEAETRRLVADIIHRRTLHSTPTLRALVKWPARRVLTSNYDRSVEQAAEEAGLRAVPLGIKDARVLQGTPPHGTLYVIHLHGVDSEPDSIVLPGKSTRLLSSDEVFLTNVRALMQQADLLYLGFRLGPGEFHLRNTLGWLTAIRNARHHYLVLPAGQVAERGEELDELLTVDEVDAVEYEPVGTDPHGFVRHLAVAGAPSADPAGRTATQLSELNSLYFPSALVQAAPDDDVDVLQARVRNAESGWQGERFTEPGELASSGRALLLASPGMGKTELMRFIAGSEFELPTLLVDGKEIAGLLEDAGVQAAQPQATHGAISVARALGKAPAGQPGTRLPTRSGLDTSSYLFLIDGLDEVGAGRRMATVQAILAAADLWPNHRWVVASRPISEVEQLTAGGFRSWRIMPSELWAERYFQHRSVADNSVEWVKTHQPAFGELLGIPMYAAAIAGRLLTEQALPDTVTELILDAHREAVGREARIQMRDEEDLGRYMTRLAVALELRGRTDATVTELAEVPGHGELSAWQTRERLVLANLLRELPGRAAFPQRTLQQALSAQAILDTGDPAGTLLRVAVGHVAGEAHFRSDIELTLDLVFESADREQRTELRKVDEPRWASTVVSRGTPEDAREALAVLYDAANQSGYSFGVFNEGLRSERGAVRAIVRRWPELVHERHEDLLAELDQPDVYRRYNALWLLIYSPGEYPEQWLGPLINDSDRSISELAARAADMLELRAVVPQLEEAASKRERRDTEHLLKTLIKLANDRDDLLRVAAQAAGLGNGLRTVAGDLVECLDLDGLLGLLELRIWDSELWAWALDQTLSREAAADWTAEQVTRLVFAVIYEEPKRYVLRRELLQELVVEHQVTTVDAAAQALYHRPQAYRGLLLLEAVDAALLAGEKNAALRDGLGRARLPQEEPFVFQQPRVPDETPVRVVLADSGAKPADVLKPNMRWRAVELDETERARLTELVEQTWTDDTWLRDHTKPDDHEAQWQLHSGRRELLGAVAAASFLDLPLSEARWFALFEARAVLDAEQSTFDWLRRQYRPDFDGGLVARIAAMPTGTALSAAIAVVEGIADHLLDAVVERLDVLTGDVAGWSNAVGMLGDRKELDRLRRLRTDRRNEQQHARLMAELAELGDRDGQLFVIAELLRPPGPEPLGHEPSPHWRETVNDSDVVEALGELYEAQRPDHRSNDLATFALGQLGAAQTESALHRLDEMNQRNPDRALRVTRAELARRLATQEVLSRLPEPLDEAALLLEQ